MLTMKSTSQSLLMYTYELISTTWAGPLTAVTRMFKMLFSGVSHVSRIEKYISKEIFNTILRYCLWLLKLPMHVNGSKNANWKFIMRMYRFFWNIKRYRSWFKELIIFVGQMCWNIWHPMNCINIFELSISNTSLPSFLSTVSSWQKPADLNLFQLIKNQVSSLF